MANEKTDPHAAPSPSPSPGGATPLGLAPVTGPLVNSPEEAFLLYSAEVANGQRPSVAFGMLLIELAELEPANPVGYAELTEARPLDAEVNRTAKLIESLPSLTVLFRCLAAGFDHAIGYSSTLPTDAVAPAHRCFRAVLLGLVDIVARLEQDVI